MARFTLAFRRVDSPIHRRNPLTIATYALCISVLGIVGEPVLLAALTLVTVGLAVIGHVGRRLLGMLLRVVVPIAIPLVAIQSLFNPIGRTVLFNIGPLAVKEEGLEFAISVVSRLVALVAAYFLLTLAVHPRDLVTTLESRGMSPRIGYLILSTMQLIPRIQQTTETILDAQRSRGLRTRGNIIVRLRAYIPLMGPVVMGSLASLEVRAMALDARGFGIGIQKTYLRVPPDPPIERRIRLALLGGTAALFVASVAITGI
jgi:energy-coupling factor transport system permease protein